MRFFRRRKQEREHQRLLSRANEWTPADHDVRECWELIVQGIEARFLWIAKLEEIVRVVDAGSGLGVEEISIDAEGEAAVITFIREQRRCARAALLAELKMFLRYVTMTVHTDDPEQHRLIRLAYAWTCAEPEVAWCWALMIEGFEASLYQPESPQLLADLLEAGTGQGAQEFMVEADGEQAIVSLLDDERRCPRAAFIRELRAFAQHLLAHQSDDARPNRSRNASRWRHT